MRNSRPMVSKKSQPVRTFSRLKLYAAVLTASQWMIAGQTMATPEGGEVVGGAGIIQQAGVETIITQATERMAIDWRSFDVAANERVEFIQPSSSSIALNRVLSNRGSEILGRIDANGQVMLVNANGVVFGRDSVVNVGGMIASGLNIDPTSFINGDFALSSIEGAEGKVINYGLINAATGGSVTLVGQQVQNDGLISAKLGSVNLVAGKAAVLTFDPTGMVGIKVTEAVVQNELGIDAAVINNGSINAEGGRVLLSASVSEDIFSAAVNNAGMNKASSVVMHEDGSFTLGAGADVINTGDISTSVNEGNAGQVVLLGENITHSGSIIADASAGMGGSIELHSSDTALLTENSNISAQAAARGAGGDIKVLGNKVGLFDQAAVNASGANGGGQVLIGGDKTGQNKQVRNADFIYLGESTKVKTDALLNGNGGKLITFASDTARIYGDLYSRGGSEGGNGGFIETSGLKGFEIFNTPDISAATGVGGAWLIDPYDIEIKDAALDGIDVDGEIFTSIDTAVLRGSFITDALKNGSIVIIQTGVSDDNSDASLGNINLNTDLNFNFSSSATLRFLAHNDIVINNNIQRANNSVTGTLNLELIANKDNLHSGGITLKDGVTVATNGGYFYAGKSAAEDSNGLLINGDHTNKLVGFSSTGATIDTTGDLGGGDIVINAAENVALGSLKFGLNYEKANAGQLVRVGSVSVFSGANVAFNGVIDFNDSGKRTKTGGNGYANNLLDDKDTDLTVFASGKIDINAEIRDGRADDTNESTRSWGGDSRDALNIFLTADENINVNANIYTAGGNFDAQARNFKSDGFLINTDRANASKNDADNWGNGNATWSNGGNVTISAKESITLGGITTDGSCAAPSATACTGNLILSGIDSNTAIDGITVIQAADSILKVFGDATFDVGTGSIKLNNIENVFDGDLIFTSAGAVEISDASAVRLGASDISGDFTLKTRGEISQVGAVSVSGTTTFDSILGGPNYKLDLSLVNNFGGRVKVINASDIKLNNGKDLSLDAFTLIGGSEDGIDVTATGVESKIILNGDITSNSKNITFNGDVEVAAVTVINADSGAINFNGTTKSASGSGSGSGLTLTGGDITFAGAVGNLSKLGDFTITSSGKVVFTDISAKSVTASAARSFSAKNINTFGTGLTNEGAEKGGGVSVTAGNITLTNINTSGGELEDGFIGINAGNIKLTANANAGSKDITINGDLIAEGAAGSEGASGAVGNVELILADSAIAGSVNLNSDNLLLSNITVKGAGSNDTLQLANSKNNKWQTTGANAGNVSEAGVSLPNIITFEGIENLIGGSDKDTFNLSHNISGSVNGSNGNDIFNIDVLSLDAAVNGGAGDDEFNINVATTKLTLNGDTGADLFNIVNTGNVTATLKGGSNDDKIVAANRENTWRLGGTEETLNQTITFSGIENVTGNDGKDIFTFNASNRIAGLVDAGGGEEDTVTVVADATINFGGSIFSGVINAEVLSSENGGKLTVNSGSSSTIDWFFTESGYSVRNSGSVVKIANFESYKGGDGIDIFNVDGDVSVVGLIDGGGGLNTFNVRNNENPYAIFVGAEYSEASSVTLTKINTINGNSAVETSLKLQTDLNAWIITGENAGRVRGINFFNISKIIGNSSSDSINTSIAKDVTWSIEGINAGKLSLTAPSENLISFTNIGNIEGSLFDDTFVFSKGASVISATGNDGTDTADLSDIDGTRVFTIGDATEFSFFGVERLIANANANFTLAATSGTNTWQIEKTSNYDGYFKAVGSDERIEFKNFKTLQGGTGADTFHFDTDFSGTVRGGDGDDIFNIKTAVSSKIFGENGVDTFAFIGAGRIDSANGGSANAGGGIWNDIANFSQSTQMLIGFDATTIFGVEGIERVVADNNKNFTLVANSESTWTIQKNGSIDGKVAGFDFEGFKNLQGSAGADTFDLNTDFTGIISGRGGDDIFNIRAAITGKLYGDGGADNFVFSGSGSVVSAFGGSEDGASDISIDKVNLSSLSGRAITISDGKKVYGVADVERVIADSGKDFTLTTSFAENTWDIADIDGAKFSGSVAGMEFIGFKALQGGTEADVFNFDQDFAGTVFGLGGDDVFNIRTVVSGSLQGGAGNDKFVFFNSGRVTNNDVSGGGGYDWADISDLDAQAITLDGGKLFNIESIERISANASKDFILKTSSGENTWIIGDSSGKLPWIIDGVNYGSVADIEFVNFQNLQGGSGVDTFDFYSDFTGKVFAGDGDDIFNIRAAISGTLRGENGHDNFNFFDGGSVKNGDGGPLGTGTDVVDVSGISAGATVTLNGAMVNNITGIEKALGGGKNFTFAAVSGTNEWSIENEGDNTIRSRLTGGSEVNISFTGFDHLEGGNGDDKFEIRNVSWLKSIDGGGGANDKADFASIEKNINVAIGKQDGFGIQLLNIETIEANDNKTYFNTLKGDVKGNVWDINGINFGLLNEKINFSGFANLTGSASADKIKFNNDSANITGHMDMGDGNDILDVSKSGRDISVQISASRSEVITGVLSINNIENLVGATNDHSYNLIAGNYDNKWTIDGKNTGNVTAAGKETINFIDFNNLTGGTQDDLFKFEFSGQVSGQVDGGAHTGRDTVDLSESNSSNVLVASLNEGFVNIEKYIGNNVNSTFTAADISNEWELSGANRGTLNSVIEFENFVTLKGGSERDRFVINNATISGSIEGGDGDDFFEIRDSVITGVMGGNGNNIFLLNITPGIEGTANIKGGSGANSLTVQGGDVGYNVRHQAGHNEYSSADKKSYSILYSDITNVVDNVVANSLSIFGSAAVADTFRLQTGRYTINNLSTVNYSNKKNLIIEGSADDQAVVDGVVNVESTVTFNNLKVLAENSGKIQAGALELVNTSDVGSATNRLNTAVNELSLSGTNGNVFLEEQDALVLKQVNVSATDLIDIKAGGNLSSAGALAYTGNLNVESVRGNIDFGINNLFTGTLNLKAAGNVILGNSQALVIGNMVAQNADLSAATGIRSSGMFSVAGLTKLSAGTDIALLNADNDINQISILNADKAEIFDKNGFTATGLNVASSLKLHSSGNIIVGTACTTDCAGYGINTRDLQIQSGASVIIAKNISAADSINIQSQGITVNDSITSKQFAFNAGSGKIILNESGSLFGQAGNGIDLIASSLEQHSTMVSNGNINVSTSGDVIMTERAQIESLNGDVVLNSRNLQLAAVKAINGSAIMATRGAITDGNGNAINVIANRWQADALNGIGTGLGRASDADAIETDVNVLSVRNAGRFQSPTSGGSINIANVDSLIIEQLRNNGDIGISTTNGDIVLDNTNNDIFDITDPDARTQGGVINANTGSGDRVLLNIGNGMVRAENKANKKNPDVISDIASFTLGRSYDFGERNRRIVMHIPEVYAQEARWSFVAWYLAKPKVITDLSQVPPDSLISGRDQLIQIEGLSEVDPAIFTSLRNYVHDEVAILLPADQRFGDEDEAF
jgi:filamentous hemagglutinin family protein